MADLIERDAAIKLIQPRVKPKTVYGEGYLNAIEHVTELLALMPSVNCWIPCSERLPKDDANVLAHNDGDGVLIASYDHYVREWMEAFECYPLTNVTHWMPLPEPPKRKDDTNDYD